MVFLLLDLSISMVYDQYLISIEKIDIADNCFYFDLDELSRDIITALKYQLWCGYDLLRCSTEIY